jgi:putative SOS response-associated peptidase YedK
MGYYEWLKKSPKEKIPHFTKRADGKIMLLAGLWDSVQYEGTSQLFELMTGSDERIYTYTIITTNAAKSVSFLHDRMPVILEPDSVEMKKWLDPNEGWSEELASMLKPYEGKLSW